MGVLLLNSRVPSMARPVGPSAFPDLSMESSSRDGISHPKKRAFYMDSPLEGVG